MRLGAFDDARACLREAFEHIEQKRERWFEADAHRVAGEIALLSPEHDEVDAEACFERALAVARSQKARSLELRAATTFARMYRDQGRRAEAYDVLAPLYAWFSEGFDKPDLHHEACGNYVRMDACNVGVVAYRRQGPGWGSPGSRRLDTSLCVLLRRL